MINNNNTHDDDDDSLSNQTSEDSTQDTQIRVDCMFIMQKIEETRVIFDEYTQKEHQKSNNKAANNPKNFVVETENGPIELATALRYERMRANTKLIRTKGRISR
ncbi:unnamed protein product [Rhizophagus irregularis]|nr:unnamed protein product [Rhizophagus irregularis]